MFGEILNLGTATNVISKNNPRQVEKLFCNHIVITKTALVAKND